MLVTQARVGHKIEFVEIHNNFPCGGGFESKGQLELRVSMKESVAKNCIVTLLGAFYITRKIVDDSSPLEPQHNLSQTGNPISCLGRKKNFT